MISKIGPYIVDSKLAEGGMGIVYKARREEAEETVALKVIRPEYAVDIDVRTKFLREIENSIVLDHPNVIAVHEAGVDAIDEAGERGQVLYYAMEYCDRGSLHDRLKIDGLLPVEAAIDLILQALDGLDYAHHVALPVETADGRRVRARGLVHRDIKPQNLFLHGGDDGVIVKIGDFGLAKAFETAGMSYIRTRTGSMAGTPEFMPRQQAINYKYAKPEVDVWAIVASLYFMLTGAFPRNFTKARNRWGIVLKDPVVPIRERNRSIPSRYAEVIDAALVESPTIQVQTAQQFKTMLEAVRLTGE